VIWHELTVSADGITGAIVSQPSTIYPFSQQLLMFLCHILRDCS